jgi:23S rRNA (cytidine1920-2'-O)/16S rRNA (cytidine1409-2'-O)-methyltransferase
MVKRGLARSRSEAADLIARRLVFVGGVVADKPSRLVAADDNIALKPEPPRFVSRGGLKLEAALRRFRVEVAGKICLDIGSAAGGFVDCLLSHGARKVFAVDVGRAQLADKLRRDSRVVVLEGVDARDLTRALVPEPIDLVTVDVSFISVKLVVPPTLELVRPGANYIVLIKPQFEAGKGEVPRGGVVRSPDVHRRVLLDVTKALQELRLSLEGSMCSPISGREGNLEYLSYWVYTQEIAG